MVILLTKMHNYKLTIVKYEQSGLIEPNRSRQEIFRFRNLSRNSTRIPVFRSRAPTPNFFCLGIFGLSSTPALVASSTSRPTKFCSEVFKGLCFGLGTLALTPSFTSARSLFAGAVVVPHLAWPWFTSSLAQVVYHLFGES